MTQFESNIIIAIIVAIPPTIAAIRNGQKQDKGITEVRELAIKVDGRLTELLASKDQQIADAKAAPAEEKHL